MGGFIITLIVATITGWLANLVSKGSMPGEAWGASLAALVGAWIGAYMPYFTFGPRIWNLAIVPAILGSLAAAFILGIFSGVVRQTSAS
ncbi:MAG: transglycosylase [Bacillota bacterium]